VQEGSGEGLEGQREVQEVQEAQEAQEGGGACGEGDRQGSPVRVTAGLGFGG